MFDALTFPLSTGDEDLRGDAMATIERGWRRLMSEVGVRFDHPGAQRLFREAGQAVGAGA